MLECVLEHILKPEHKQKGFSLQEESDYFLHLFYKGQRVATFTQHVRVDDLWQAVDSLAVKYG